MHIRTAYGTGAVVKRNHPVVFVVTFSDHTTARIAIDSKTLLHGDQAVEAVLEERKRARLLPDKPAKSIKRVERR